MLSAFTGLGGLDLGLEKAGFRTVAAIELDASARATIKRNRPRWNLLDEGDIAKVRGSLRPAKLGLRRRQLGVLVGGPPCQPFSKAAQWAEKGRRGLADPRAKPLRSFLGLVEMFLPRVILIENVPGFVRGATSALPVIERALSRINARNRTHYQLEWRVLNTADFGVPQRRQRAILVARRDGRPFKWPTPTHEKLPVRAYDALNDIHPDNPPPMTGYWADLLSSIPEGGNYQFHTPDGAGEPLFGRRRKFWSFLLKLAKGEPAWTISAQPGPATGPFHWESRPLTTQELLRLQTFPKAWCVEGGSREQIRQIGNATPALFAEVIGRAIGDNVFSLRYRKGLQLKIARRRIVPRRHARRSVPSKYLNLRAPHLPHPGVGEGPGAKARLSSSG